MKSALKYIFYDIIIPLLGIVFICLIGGLLSAGGYYMFSVNNDSSETNIVISEKTAFNDTVTIDVYGRREHAAVTYDKYVIDSDDNITRVTIFKRTTKDGKSTEYVILKAIDKDDYIKDLK